MSTSRALRLGALAIAAVGALSACSSGSSGGGNSIPSLGSSAAPPASSGATLAPSVPQALSADGLVADPCSALSAAQVKQIGLTGAGTSSRDQAGPSCKWKSATSDSNVVYIAPMTANANGLSDIYAGKAKDKYFEATTVASYPAVYADITDNRTGGDCTLWVGVTDQLAVFVSTQIGQGSNKSNPCPVVERVATAMIKHLQGSE
jgi:hypothetical protein